MELAEMCELDNSAAASWGDGFLFEDLSSDLLHMKELK
jgi:hypothetical protein